MRILGFLFLIVLLLTAVGYFRGWFSVSTTHAAGKSDVTVGVDQDKMRDDARAAAAKIGQLSAKAAAAVKSLGRKAGPDESDLEGNVKAVDVAARDLTLTSGTETIDLHVPTGVPITRHAATVGFEQLLPATRVKLTFKHAGDERSLARIEILQ